MSIYAPSHCLIASGPFSQHFEREKLFQILGCCWGLSAKNINNEFAIQLLIDLKKITLTHGSPLDLISEDIVNDLLNAFKVRANHDQTRKMTENNILKLLNTMSVTDYINFQIGLHDTVEQILSQDPLWSTYCDQSYLTLRYFSLSLLRAFADDDKKNIYAKLMTNFIENTRNERKKGFNNTTFIWFEADKD